MLICDFLFCILICSICYHTVPNDSHDGRAYLIFKAKHLSYPTENDPVEYTRSPKYSAKNYLFHTHTLVPKHVRVESHTPDTTLELVAQLDNQ